MHTLKAAFLHFLLFFSSPYPPEKMPVKQASFRAQILDEVNALRSSGCNCGNRFMPPAPPLKWSNLLERSAMVHARDMRNRSFFSHTGSDGSSITQRIRRQGFITPVTRTYFVAENIAFGYPTTKRVIYEWKISEHHCLNMMNPKLTDMGVAELDKYWVQDLGTAR